MLCKPLWISRVYSHAKNARKSNIKGEALALPRGGYHDLAIGRPRSRCSTMSVAVRKNRPQKVDGNGPTCMDERLVVPDSCSMTRVIQHTGPPAACHVQHAAQNIRRGMWQTYNRRGMWQTYNRTAIAIWTSDAWCQTIRTADSREGTAVSIDESKTKAVTDFSDAAEIILFDMRRKQKDRGKDLSAAADETRPVERA